MVDKKYQIFVSSTYTDLKNERDVVIKAILEMGHIPVGMEMFSAADDEQWKIIERHIEESDYYCVIVAHRYGSTVSGKSYTQKEYEHALHREVPVLGFIIDDAADWPADAVDTKPSEAKSLKAFKALVRSKPVSFWRNAEDLYGRVSIALSKAFTANPRAGWMRATSDSGPEALKELTRLSAENAALRRELVEAKEESESGRLAKVRELAEDLKGYDTTLSYKYSQHDESWNTSTVSLYQLFCYCSPSLLTEYEVQEAATDLAMNIRKVKGKKTWWTVAINQVSTLFGDFVALGLVEPSKRKHGVADKGQYWTLTEQGIELHNFIRLKELERVSVPPDSSDMPKAVDTEKSVEKT